jgi:hypothetical protein
VLGSGVDVAGEIDRRDLAADAAAAAREGPIPLAGDHPSSGALDARALDARIDAFPTRRPDRGSHPQETTTNPLRSGQPVRRGPDTVRLRT